MLFVNILQYRVAQNMLQQNNDDFYNGEDNCFRFFLAGQFLSSYSRLGTSLVSEIL